MAEQFQGWTPYNYTLQNPVNLTDPTGMAPEGTDDFDNRYRIYRKNNGDVTRVEYVNNDGEDEIDYITEINVDQPMMYASSSKSYSTQVSKYESRVKTNNSSKNGEIFGVDRGPGYSHSYVYQTQSQAIQPMDFDSPFFIGGGVALKLLSRASVAENSSKILSTTSKQLQAKFKHASDFGVIGNYSKQNAIKFNSAINQHINSTGVQSINGTYRGQSVIHYLNQKTGVNVISSPSGQFISGWKLTGDQFKNVLNRGKL